MPSSPPRPMQHQQQYTHPIDAYFQSDDDEEENESEEGFDFELPDSPRAPPPQQRSSRPPTVSRTTYGVRRMSSVPELGQTPRSPAKRVPSQQHIHSRQRSNTRDVTHSHRVPSYEIGQGGSRLLRQKSIERGIVMTRPSPGKRIISGGGPPGGQGVGWDSRPGSRPGSRTGSRPGSRDIHLPHSAMPQQSRPQPPHAQAGLKMPLAFNSMNRERGFSISSQSSQHQPYQALVHSGHGGRSQQRISPGSDLPTPPASTAAAPDLFESRPQTNQRLFHREPPRSHPYPIQPPFSAPISLNNSPHSSIGIGFAVSNVDELQASFRSVLPSDDMNRTSSFTTTSEAPTDDSHAMTVDEAIGMYGSDTDDEEMYQSGMESEYRRSKGDSVLGGSSFSDGGFVYRRKGDSVLGGETSPDTRSRNSAQSQVSRVSHCSQLEPPTPNEDRDDHSSRSSARYSQKSISPTERRSIQLPTVVSEDADADATAGDDASADTREIILNSRPAPQIVEPIPETAHESAEEEGETIPAQQDEPEPQPESPAPQYTPREADLESLRPVATEPPLPPVEKRDRYGFKKQTQYITLAEYEEWEGRYNGDLDRRRKKWEQLLRESGLAPGEGGPVRFPPKSNKIKRYVRKGIPPEWRGAAWFWYAGGQKFLTKYQGKYEELVNSPTLPSDSELIERDLHRTFPDNIKFKPDPPPGVTRMSKLQEKQFETPMLQSLRRVLLAFALYVPKIGYCQSLNFLAGLLLLFMEEEKAFWMLYILTQTHLPGTHELNLEGSSVDQWVLMSSVRDSLPHIWQKIGGGLDGSEVDMSSTKLPPVTLCTSSWFMSGFIGSLPIETTLRVWDCLFYDGSKTLFRIALTVFKTGEHQIKSVHDPMEIFQVVQTIPRKLLDAGALIEACYRRRNGFGHLSQETVDEKRAERRKAFAEERALIASGQQRLSRDDGGLRAGFDGTAASARGGFTGFGNDRHHGELGRKFRKILVKT
ncbi:hypothetical protein FPQ18DRAFT_334314 [Pyronema domesticum]|nr:hypothetical protein FPQ18DRAFT_334314 [Pyronema domesticum]